MGFHNWPPPGEAVGGFHQASTEAGRLYPRRADRSGQLSSLTSEMEEMGSAIVSLHQDI
jgi:hypothetical protein